MHSAYCRCMQVGLAVDVGGTKMAAGLVGADGTVLARAQVPTPASPGPEVVFAALASVLTEFLVEGCVACGVGSGGPMAAGGETLSPLLTATDLR